VTVTLKGKRGKSWYIAFRDSEGGVAEFRLEMIPLADRKQLLAAVVPFIGVVVEKVGPVDEFIARYSGVSPDEFYGQCDSDS
jgi:hypothetical protein